MNVDLEIELDPNRRLRNFDVFDVALNLVH
jgi:hypothetical protein